MTEMEAQQFLENLRREKTAFCVANGLPVPAFDKEEDYYLADTGYWEWKEGIPRIPQGANRLTWRSKNGNLVIVDFNGYARDGAGDYYRRAGEVLARLAAYEDTGLEPEEVAPVVHGYWINIPPYHAMNGNYNKAQECSVCRAFYVSSGNTPYSNHPYCAECGAKMDLKEEDHGKTD